jgi:putative thymidine phosphorylase
MKLKARTFEFFAGRPVAILNTHTAHKLNIHVDERITIMKGKKKIISVIDTTSQLVKEKEIVLSNEIVKELNLREGSNVEVDIAKEPDSTRLIKKKINCGTLSLDELKQIMSDIVKNALTETEIAYFISGIYKCGMTNKETEELIKAMVSVGKRIKFKGKVVDKHSIGGVAGNRTTPLVVSICTASGLIFPKTSSRAITSAAATADVVEAIADVEFNTTKLKKIVHKTGACLAWGGSLGLSPADDKIIQIEKILHIDPEPQLLASIISKKISVGSKYVIIDIPYGPSAKVTKQRAKKLKKDFEFLSKKFNLKLKCVLTDGSHPIGNSVGPNLEMNDIIKILKRDPDRPIDLEEKSVFLAGQILELSGKAKKGQGKNLALKILDSGKAFKKFEQIIKAQNGKIPNKFEFGKFKYTFNASKKQKIKSIDNKKINMTAILSGTPMDKQAGLYLHVHKNNLIKKGHPILTIYSNSRTRLQEAKEYFKKAKPIK